MLVLSKIYKCDVCGNIVQILHEGAGELVCCHQAMLKLKEQSADFKTEKHVPIIEQRDCGFLIKVGSTLHPMEDKHFIEWIELIADGVSYFKYLKPGDTPEIFFHIEAKEINAREYCNIHGLWRNQGSVARINYECRKIVIRQLQA